MTEPSIYPFQEQNRIEYRTGEETFRRAFEYAAFAMALIGTDGSFLQVNQSACEMFGYPAEELITKTFRELTYPDDLEVGLELFRDLLAGRRDYGWLEKRYVRKNGKVIWTLLSTAVIRDSQGEPLYLVSQIQDITEHKEAEAGLAEREAQYRSIFEVTLDGLIIGDLDGAIVEVNPAFCEMHGYDREEITAMHLTTIVRPDGHCPFEECLEAVRAGGTFQGRAVDLRKDGTLFPVQLYGKPFIYRGEPHILGVVRDVTEQVQARRMLEERVAARTRELSALYDVTAVASASLDLETVMEQSLDRVLDVMDCRIGGIHLLDASTSEMSLATWRNIPGEVIPQIQTMQLGSGVAGRVIARGAPLVELAMADAPDALPAAKHVFGRRGYVGAPMRAKGQVVGVLSVIAAEGRQFSAEEVAMLASIADQIGVSVENARLFQQAERLAIVEERQRLARKLHDSVTQAVYSATLLNETARRSAAAGKREETLGYLDELGAIILQALKEMRLLIYELRPPALEQDGLVVALQQRIDAVEGRAGIRSRLLVEGEIDPEPCVEEALYRIGQEALNNALKHAAADSVTIRIRVSNDGLIEMEVADDGQGFDLGAVSEGVGMGLTTMLERSRQVGGTLSIQSTPGKGTSVKIAVQARMAGNQQHAGRM